MADSWCPFRPGAAERMRLAEDVQAVSEIQTQLQTRHPALAFADRVAHQYQIAGGRVALEVQRELPDELEGLGLFIPGATHVGIGRLSTGLGVPHLETNPDFLGMMLAFRTGGQRVDLLGINDPSAPTDDHRDFLSVLQATADAAGAEMPLLGDWGEYDLGNLLVEQTELALGLKRHLGLIKALKTLAHLLTQTARTFRSSTACQPYWTGILEARGRAGKFTIVPLLDENSFPGVRPGERYLSEEWATRLALGPITFSLCWIPWLDERRTSTEKLTEPWEERHRQTVGQISFLPAESTEEAMLWKTLAAEMGANPGNWVACDQDPPEVPGTELTAARQIAYALSQEGRGELEPEQYAEVFTSGEISPNLAAELQRRAERAQRSGHQRMAPSR